MKIEEIQLRSFGPFTNLDLSFDGETGNFHILYGPNEAGKSSALRALRSLLYGIPHNSSDNFLHENNKLRIGGRLLNADGSRISFLRRKGTKVTLMDPEERPLGEDALERFLHGVTEEMFTAFFGIDHDTLVRGAQTILQGGGEVGQSLFSAGMGGANLRAILESLDTEADAIFRPRGQTQVLNKAISDYANLKKIVAEESLPGKKWTEHNRELEKVLNERDGISRQMRKLMYENSRLERIRQALPNIALRASKVSALAELGDVVIVDDGFGKKRQKYLDQLRNGTDLEERTVIYLEQLRNTISQVAIPERLLDQADTVSSTHQRLGSYRKGLLDLNRLQGNLQQLSADIGVLFSEIKPGMDFEQSPGFRPNAALKAKIQELGGQYQALHDALARAKKDMVKSEGELSRIQGELRGPDVPKNAEALKLAISRSRKRGDLAASLEEALGGLRAEEEQIRLDLCRLPKWSGEIEELEKAPVPSSETIDRFEFILQDILAKQKSLEAQEKAVRTELATVAQKIETLRIAGAVPTEDELSRARARRDLGWGIVLRSWTEHKAIQETESAFDDQDPLPRAYEKSVIEADEIADRLRREADRVAQNADLMVRRDGILKTIEDIDKEKEDLAHRLNKTNLEWNAQWEPAGIEALPPREMRSWTRHHQALLERAKRLRELRHNCGQIAGHIDHHRGELITSLRNLGMELPSDETLDGLLTYSQSLVDSIEKVNRRREFLKERATELESNIEELQKNSESLERKFERWQSDWKTAVLKLSLEPQALPAEAYAILSKVDELFKKVDERASIERRVLGINRDAGEFSADVESLVKRVAPELEGLPVDQAVAQLNAMVSKAKADSAKLSVMHDQVDEQERVLRGAEATISGAMTQLNALCLQAGCEVFEDLEKIEQKSFLKKSIMREIESTEARLLEIGGGMSIQELMAEAETVDGDSLPGMIMEVSRSLEELEAKRSELEQKVGSLQTILSQMDGNGRAAEAAEQSQQVLSSMRENVERYVRLRLSSGILRQEIERYRAENQGPLLKRASDLFSALALKSFSGLTTDFNSRDEPVLVGLRPSGEHTDVSGMSDGTRDQLYLALRIASLEKYLDTNEPMPFIVDDILIRFDDKRAEAALKVLADLSRDTQILFLTHHSRLVELAKKESLSMTPKIHFL